jgi:hypothetical protein
MLQAPFSRRTAELKVWWKRAEGHGFTNSECTTAETVSPAKVNSTFGSLFRVGSLCQDFSNSVRSMELLSSAMNLCIKHPPPERLAVVEGTDFPQ